MILLYNLGISIYSLLLRVFSLFDPKAKKFVEGRRNYFTTLKKSLARCIKPIAWVHCASVGEFEQGRPLIEKFREIYPNYHVLLTFFSPSGYELHKNYAGVDWVFYLPFDTGKNTKIFLDLVQPKLVFLIKYEFWYHFLCACNQRNIPVYSVSSIFRKNQFFFTFYGKWFLKGLEAMDHFFVQNKESLQLLSSKGFENVSLIGDTRIDRVWQIAQHPKSFDWVDSFKQGNKLLVAGSTWKADVKVISGISTVGLKMIIVPHEINRNQIDYIEKMFPKKQCICYTKMVSGKSWSNYDIVIIDIVGFLSSLYACADLAFIGGAFGAGLHNILEAAVYGVPIFFGNQNFIKFQEAKDLIAQKTAFAVADQSELNTLINNHDWKEWQRIGHLNRKYVQNKRGTTQLILDAIDQKIN